MLKKHVVPVVWNVLYEYNPIRHVRSGRSWNLQCTNKILQNVERKDKKEDQTLSNTQGVTCGGIYGFGSMLMKYLKGSGATAY